MKVKKKEEKELEKKLKRDQKKIKKRAEITEKRLKIDPTYVEESETSLQEVNQIFILITEVNCALEKLIEKYIMSDLKSLNHLRTEVKEEIKKEINSHAEMLNTAKNIVQKVEKVNEFLSYKGKNENSEVNKNFQDSYPTQSGSSGSNSPNPPQRKCKKKIFILQE